MQVLWVELSAHLEEFRSSVRRRTAERVQLTAHCELIAEAKVGYFNVHVGVQQEILCLRDTKKFLFFNFKFSLLECVHNSTLHVKFSTANAGTQV